LIRVVLEEPPGLGTPAYRVLYSAPGSPATPNVDVLVDAARDGPETAAFRLAAATVRAEAALGGPVALVSANATWTATTAVLRREGVDVTVVEENPTGPDYAPRADVARATGARDAVRSDGPWKDQVLELTGGRGVDLVFDPVGGDRVLDTMRCLAPSGRWLVIGFVGGAIPEIALNRVLLRNIDVVGAYYGGWLGGHPDARGEIGRRVGDLLLTGHLKPVVGSVHGLDNPGETIREMAERRAVGKVVLRMR